MVLVAVQLPSVWRREDYLSCLSKTALVPAGTWTKLAQKSFAQRLKANPLQRRGARTGWKPTILGDAFFTTTGADALGCSTGRKPVLVIICLEKTREFPESFFFETKTRHENIARIARNARIAIVDVPKVNYCNFWVQGSILQSEQSEQYFQTIPDAFSQCFSKSRHAICNTILAIIGFGTSVFAIRAI